MIKIFQKRWFDIEFEIIDRLNHKTLPSEQFYKKFYQLFYQRYQHPDELPTDYLQSKLALAKQLAQAIHSKQTHKILSVGCGNGIVEKYLIKQLPNILLIAHEPNANNASWLQDESRIQVCGESLEHILIANPDIDYIYLSTMEYALSDEAYILLLSQIRKLSSATVMITGIIKPLPNWFTWCKYWLKYCLAHLNLYRLGQLWGYLRYFHEHKAIFKKANYIIINHGDLPNDLMWIELSPKK